MKIELTSQSPVKKTLAVEVPGTDVATIYGELLRSYAKSVRLPGFRPGKAPLEMVRAKLGRDLGAEAAERVVERYGREAIRREGLRPVQGGVALRLREGEKDPSPAVDGESYSFTIEVDVYPEIELGTYTGLKVSRPNVEVEVEELQRELEQLRQSLGKLVDVTDRGADSGDFVAATLTGVELGGELRLDSQRHTVHLGAEGTLPEFGRAMAGRRVGDELAFEVTYPAEFPNEQVRGRTVTFAGAVAEVKRAEIPELSDELVQPLGVESVAVLRERVRERILARKNHDADRTVRTRLVERLLDAHPFDAPEVLIEEELRQRLEGIGRNLAAQGIDPDKVEIDWKQVLERERDNARRQVREQILLDTVIRKEGMTLSKQEFDHAVEHLAHDSGMKLNEVRTRLRERAVAEEFATQVLRGKCLDWLVTQADIV